MRGVRNVWIGSAFLVLAAGCGDSKADTETGKSVDLGLEKGLSAAQVIDGLNNPCGLSFRGDGALTVCAAGSGATHGNGRVVVRKDGKSEDYITGFATEFWKPGKDGQPNRFKLGPLSTLWLDASKLVVSNGGLKDGSDNLLFFDKGGKASDGAASNGIAKTSSDAADKGEGNLIGLCPGGQAGTLYLCGQGADAKSWLLSCSVADRKVATFASSDDNGIKVNSPMVALPWEGDTILVLYSGAGGKEDGLIVQWDTKSKKPQAQWTLPGVFDPMGMAQVPNSKDLVVVDNNWDLKTVKDGRLARVTLTAGGGKATVKMLGSKLKGPTSCAFGTDGKLYVALLGPEFDKSQGSVVAISGIK